MRYIIAGGRDFTDYDRMVNACKRIISGDDTIVTGGAKGADALGKQMANQFRFPHSEFPADWDKHKKSAGPIRNQQMAQNADGLIAFWDGKSKGTRDMIQKALNYGLEVHVYSYGRT